MDASIKKKIRKFTKYDKTMDTLGADFILFLNHASIAAIPKDRTCTKVAVNYCPQKEVPH